VELCGGTHVSRTGDIAVFSVLGESGVAAGIRRIEAATGASALAHLKQRAAIARDVSDLLKTPTLETPARVAQLVEQRKKLEQELADARRKLAMGGGGQAAGPEDVAGVRFLGKVAEGLAAKDLKGLVDEAKTALGSGVVVFIAINEGKAAVVVGVTADLTARFSAVDMVKAAAAALGGTGGGGRPDMAQAGGPDGDKADAALAAIRAMLAG
jgi:alanyl-tRNA synthetase